MYSPLSQKNDTALPCLFFFCLASPQAGEENGNPLQYSCLENSMDRGAW